MWEGAQGAAAEASFFRDPLPGAEGGRRERRVLSPTSGPTGRLLEPSASEAGPLDQRSQGKTIPRAKPGTPRFQASTALLTCQAWGRDCGHPGRCSDRGALPSYVCVHWTCNRPSLHGSAGGGILPSFFLVLEGRTGAGHRSHTSGVPEASLGS